MGGPIARKGENSDQEKEKSIKIVGQYEEIKKSQTGSGKCATSGHWQNGRWGEKSR